MGILSYLKLFFCSCVLLLTACSSEHAVPVETLSQLSAAADAMNPTTPKTAVLLLPLHGQFADEGQRVRDGFLAEHRKVDTAHSINVQVLDTQNYADPHSAYQAAVALNPDLIIGPLTKPAVNALLNETSLPIATLALNQTGPDSVMPANLFEFSLNPQAEAADTAQKIEAEGYHHVIVIAPASDWEQNIVTQFNDAWVEDADASIDSITYQVPTDIAEAIKNAAKQRSPDELKQTAIFCIVTAQNAPKVLTAVRDAFPTLPIYSLPMVFDDSNLAALENVSFEISPWVLETQHVLQTELRLSDPQISFEHMRLNAFGRDAFTLTQFYLNSGSFQNLAIPGLSGYLTINTHNVVQRQLTWSIVKNNALMPLMPNPQITAAQDQPTDVQRSPSDA
jgi:hypothetical protein